MEMLKTKSLRKLIKEYMKKCRSNSKLQYLAPICMRLVTFYFYLRSFCSSQLWYTCKSVWRYFAAS